MLKHIQIQWFASASIYDIVWLTIITGCLTTLYLIYALVISVNCLALVPVVINLCWNILIFDCVILNLIFQYFNKEFSFIFNISHHLWKVLKVQFTPSWTQPKAIFYSFPQLQCLRTPIKHYPTKKQIKNTIQYVKTLVQQLNTTKAQKKNTYLLKITAATPNNQLNDLLFFKCEKSWWILQTFVILSHLRFSLQETLSKSFKNWVKTFWFEELFKMHALQPFKFASA